MARKQVIRMQVKWADGRWKLPDGSPMQFEEGSEGELRVNSKHLGDGRSLEVLTAERKVTVLPVGTELRVALTIASDLTPALLLHLLPFKATLYDPTATISAQSRFVAVTLLEATNALGLKDTEMSGLWLAFRGMEYLGMKSGPVGFTSTLGLEPARSLNHAFTCLSEIFEPWRDSHTGNVYERVFYQEQGDRWYPLKDIRDPSLASDARPFIKELWGRVNK